MRKSLAPGNAVRMLLLILGLLLFCYLIYQIGLEALVQQLRRIGWWFLPILFISLAWFVCTSMAWKTIILSFGYDVPLPHLLRLKLISESINVVVPSANLGGEGARAYLLKRRVPGTIAVSSVILDKTLDNIGKTLFTIFAVGISLFLVTIPADWIYIVVAGLALVVVFNVLTVLVQTAGMFGKSLPFLSRVPWLGNKIQSRYEQFEKLDAHLKGNVPEQSPRSVYGPALAPVSMDS